MALVRTIDGDIEESLLTKKIIHIDGENTLEVVVEWFHGEKLVRRDGWVNMKQGLTLTGTAQEF